MTTMRAANVALLLSLGLVAVGAYALFQRARANELALANEGLQMVQDTNRVQAVQCSSTIADVRRKLDTCQSKLDQPPQAAGQWWCYRDHQCFRSAGECTKAGTEDDRAVECISTGQAWCGGKDGHECFAEACDCRALEVKTGQLCVPVR
jgi:hypothetical protein